MAYLLQKKCENVEHVIYEKNGKAANVGGFRYADQMLTNVFNI
jgi:hypothetical protein